MILAIVLSIILIIFSVYYLYNNIQISNNKYTEEYILCDLIENYIEIANKNDNTIDDYISIISLIKILQIQYKQYSHSFQKYMDFFQQQGILDKYQLYFKNIPKKIFIENKFKPNTELSYEMLYGFFNGCSSRFINYLILFGLCGNPKTKKQKHIMAHIFEGNSSLFYKQKIYYISLYLKSGILADGYYNSFLEKINYINVKKYTLLKHLGESYIKDDQYNKAIYCLNKAKIHMMFTNLNKQKCKEKIAERVNYAKSKIK